MLRNSYFIWAAQLIATGLMVYYESTLYVCIVAGLTVWLITNTLAAVKHARRGAAVFNQMSSDDQACSLCGKHHTPVYNHSRH